MFSFQDIKEQPFKYFSIYRKRISNMRRFIYKELSQFSIGTELSIFIGTEKDNFTQIFLNQVYKIKKTRIKLIAVEEGSGFYRSEKFKDKLKQIFYRLFTPVLFNEKLEYHRQLGTDNRINEIYARLPELIPQHKNSHKIKYHRYNLGRPPDSGKAIVGGILIFSFPNKNYPITDIQKREILEDLIKSLSQGQPVYIKPHPREDLNVISSLENVVVLDKNYSGEEIEYFDYSRIINFSSSIVIDLLSSGYPSGRIYTINLDDSNLSFFKQTNYIDISQIKNIAVED